MNLFFQFLNSQFKRLAIIMGIAGILFVVG